MRFSADSRPIRCLARGDECQSARPHFRRLHLYAKDRENMRSHANCLGRSQHSDLDFHFSVIASRTHMLAVILTGLPPHDLSSAIPFAGGSSTSSHLCSRLLLLRSPCAVILRATFSSLLSLSNESTVYLCIQIVAAIDEMQMVRFRSAGALNSRKGLVAGTRGKVLTRCFYIALCRRLEAMRGH